MKLEHEFTVAAPIDTVWQALLDPERVAPCFPGATITSASGDEFTGTVKVRLGPISLQYRGSGRFTGTEPAAHQTTIEASGTAAGGQGTAAAKVHASLAENGQGTTVNVITDLSITGKPAQFGRGLIEDVGKKIIGQFADCLSKSLGSADEPAPAAPPPPSGATPPTPAPPSPPSTTQPASGQPAPPRLVPPPVTDEIDLLDAAGGAVAKRAVPAAAGLIVLALVLRWLRRRRKARKAVPAPAAVSAPSLTPVLAVVTPELTEQP
ncbi:MAG: SRPBCC family protein [Actinomycetota bacterium]|jgi:carbon monoxide dehydrogenase subunit G|nr:SRPBCC family protein [Actinomycetota bacterium]